MNDSNEIEYLVTYSFLLTISIFLSLMTICFVILVFCKCKRKKDQIPEKIGEIAGVLFSEEDNKIDCSICLDTSLENEVIVLSLCSHKFHKSCVYNLDICPNCREQIARDII